MKLYNTLTKSVEEVVDDDIGIYSCGPTTYNHVHIGNMMAFTIADTLRRVLVDAKGQVTHVMNITDVDDKTIRGSQTEYPDADPAEALKKHTRHYETVFIEDMRLLGNDIDALQLVRATESIAPMQDLIRQLHAAGIAYTADDGVYFSIDKYQTKGKTYGQLVNITAESTGAARVNNDEYDKDNIHDFALWKKQKPNEPSWPFELDGVDMAGRPGWHIECSAMATAALGQPFTIHTGGIDLAFPHHENEIAQSTGADGDTFAKWFVHNEHVLVEGKKMSKSLNNFFTLTDIIDKGYDPLAFRLLILQGHYRKQTNFSWYNLDAAGNRLHSLRELAELRFQGLDFSSEDELELLVRAQADIRKALQEDLNTPRALAVLSEVTDTLSASGVSRHGLEQFEKFLEFVDKIFGLKLLESTRDIDDKQKQLVAKRQAARAAKDFDSADKARDELAKQHITLNDTPNGVLWHREAKKKQ